MSIRNYTVLPLALAVTLPLSAADLEQRVEVLERQVRTMSELVLRMERLQREVQQLRGEMELQGNEMGALKKRQRDLYLDLDQRLGAGAAPAGAEPGTQVADGVTADAPPATPSGEPSAAIPGDGAAPVALASVASAQEERAYQKAFELLTQRRYDEARPAFEKFLRQYPTGAYADNAQYWLGEASYVTRDFERAQAEFEKVLNSYPDSPKVSGALLKIGYIQFNQRQPEQARATLDNLIARFPETSAARLAQEFIRKKKL